MAKIQDIDIPYLEFAEAAAPGTPAAAISRIYVKADGLFYSKDDAGAETLMSGGAGGAPSTADYLVGTAQGGLSAEIVVGATPGGELGGTWATPTVDATHSGSAHLLAANTGLIGITAYAPTTQTVYTRTAASMADVDATNLIVTFTAPASGNVLVRLSAFADQNNTLSESYWGLRESTTDLTGIARVLRNAAAETGSYLSVVFYLTGISGGSHTYKWSFAVGVAAQTTRIITQDGSVIGEWGPATMEVWAAP